ncbi:DUF441 domain-containing protein [Cohnella thailandensis]|uniref:UPF0756 membrane protein H7B67_15575 n=1 Tax=Cohnella thailandensis TaxID=557557 RepID=A0A841SX96_9BACL|nr:DUF441 domain-containing protein [Cohnella thailandensis]MBB6635539.1 DUF441 domain-containing protein [Cohnella thailandensis]MBP1974919.1 uncharacterized membrane protein (DUF441 family) [Cohnella thailandensis]
MNGEIVLVGLIVIGLIGRSPIITTAACLLLIVKLVHLQRYLPSIERRGLEIGLLFLTLAVLVPFASGKVQLKDVAHAFTSWTGWVALIGGAAATYMNGKGLELLKVDPQLIVGLVIGSIIGIVMLRGIPVGPLMAAGITAFILKVLQLFTDK